MGLRAAARLSRGGQALQLCKQGDSELQGFCGFLGPIFVDFGCTMSQRNLAQPNFSKNIPKKDTDDKAYVFFSFFFLFGRVFRGKKIFKGPKMSKRVKKDQSLQISV